MKKFLIFALCVIALSGCSPKEAGRWNGSYSHKIAELPSDVCISNGVPVIYGVSTESDGGYVLIYLRNNGDVVAAQWLTDQFVGLVLKQSGELYWSGAKCGLK